VTVSNDDWARAIATPTTETIDHALQQDARVKLEPGRRYRFDGKGFVEKLTPQQAAAIHILIRQAIATELEKLVHSFNCRPGGLISPANVAYIIAEVVEKIRSWEPTWNVITEYADGSPPEEHPFEYLNEALLDAGIRAQLEGMDKTMRMR